MPSPNEIRGPFLKYLRKQLPHGRYWVDVEGVFSAAEVRAAIKRLEHKNPKLHRILDKYITNKAARSQIADSESYDSSTIKRKLDDALDLVLQNLKMVRRPIPTELITEITAVVPKAQPMVATVITDETPEEVPALNPAE